MACCTRASDRVTIQSDTGDAGDEQATFTDGAASVPCSIESIKGQERWRGRQLEATVDYAVEFPTRRTDLTSETRLVVTGGIHDGVTMNASYVQQVQATDKRRTHTLAFCTELA